MQTSSYNDASNELNGSVSTVHTPSGLLGENGAQRPSRPLPRPQYQTLDPSTIGVACYEPIDPQKDYNDSELYEKLDFRTMDTPQNYGQPAYAKPIPEYLELVSDTNSPQVKNASNGTSLKSGKQYYEPMEGGLNQEHGDKFHGQYSDQNYEPMAGAIKPDSPKYYEPMSSGMDKANTSPDSPKYYEPMTINKIDDPFVKPKGSSSSANYHQPMAENNVNQTTVASTPHDYYVPMSQNSLTSSPEYSKNKDVNDSSSKL